MQCPSPFEQYFIDEAGLIKTRDGIQVPCWRSGSGYLCCNIWNSNLNRVQPCVYVHRLMTMTWLPGQIGEVDHIDRNKLNNSLSNLRVVSRSENLKNRTSWTWSVAARNRQNMRNLNAPDYFERKLLKIQV